MILGQSGSKLVSLEDAKFFLENQSTMVSKGTGQGKNGHRGATKRALVRSPHLITGLFNEGATCYLNSVLQCLLQCHSFSKSIIALDNKKQQHNLIICNLQLLFARLLKANQHAVRTEDLLLSFGWSTDEIYQQHDAHELFSLLLSALEGCHLPSITPALESFQGDEKTTLTCPECGYIQHCLNKFNCLSLEVSSPNFQDEKETNITELLSRSLLPEQLDEDNRWTCANCHKPVCATKQISYASSHIPEHLCIQLKRFSFDRKTFRRLKISSPVSISPTITMTFTDITDGLCKPSLIDYELTGIVCHFGTAMGGHYRALVRCGGAQSQWYECDDDNITPVNIEELLAALSVTSHATSSAPMTIDSNKDEKTKHRLSLLTENAYLLFYSKKQNVSQSYDISANITPIIQDIISKENNAFLDKLKIEKIRQNMVELVLLLPRAGHNDGDNVHQHHHKRVLFPKDINCGYLRELMIRQWYSSLPKDHFEAPRLVELIQKRENARIRRIFHPQLTRNNLSSPKHNEETFMGRESHSLSSLNFQDGDTLSLDIRMSEKDAYFQEYHPNDLLIDVQVFDNNNDANDKTFDRETGWTNVTIPVFTSNNINIASSLTSIALQPTMFHCHEIIQQQYPFLQKQPYYLAYFPNIANIANSTSKLKHRQENDIHNTQDNNDIVQFECFFLPNGFFNGSYIDEQSNQFYLRPVVNDNATDPLTTFDNNHSLSLKHNDRIVVVPVSTDFVSCSSERKLKKERELLKQLEETRSKITIFFNDPFVEECENNTASNDPYSFHVDISSGITLSSLRLIIQQYFVSLWEKRNDNVFHFKKSQHGTQLKDESRTLTECDIGHQGLLHLQAGKGCLVGEISLRLELQTSKQSFNYVKDIIVAEKATILQIKQQIFNCWHEIVQIYGNDKDKALSVLSPKTFHHLRIKDLAKQPPVTLRDDRILNRCLLNLSDGRRLGVQVLSFAEILTAEEILIHVKVANYCEKKLMTLEDSLAVSRHWHAGQLYRHLMAIVFPPQDNETNNTRDLNKTTNCNSIYTTNDTNISNNSNMDAKHQLRLLKSHMDGVASDSSDSEDEPNSPDVQIILDETNPPNNNNNSNPDNFPMKETDLVLDIAKAFSTGPPLTLKNSEKLKWNDCFSFDTDITSWPSIDKAPLLLRDGSIIVVRNHADYLAPATVTEKDETAVTTVPVVAGTGLSVVRARKAAENSNHNNSTINVDTTTNNNKSNSISNSNDSNTVLKPWQKTTKASSVVAMRKKIQANKTNHGATSEVTVSQRREPKLRIGHFQDTAVTQIHTYVPDEDAPNLPIISTSATQVAILSPQKICKDEVKQEQHPQKLEENDDDPISDNIHNEAQTTAIHHKNNNNNIKILNRESATAVSSSQMLMNLQVKNKAFLLVDEPPPSPAKAPQLVEERSRPPPLM